MSQQRHMWSKFMAAALSNPYVCDENESIDTVTERAAKIADHALAEYNKRTESLAKLEGEISEAWRLIAIRDEQVAIGTKTLMVASDLLESWRRDQNNLEPHWVNALEELVRRHLHLVENTYTTVPSGMYPSDPKLYRGSR